jgi:hypothetical protein
VHPEKSKAARTLRGETPSSCSGCAGLVSGFEGKLGSGFVVFDLVNTGCLLERDLAATAGIVLQTPLCALLGGAIWQMLAMTISLDDKNASSKS